MSKTAALPDELLLNIFNYIDSCRITCKSWNNPAAEAMFGKKIPINTELGAIKLYRHLFRDPSKIPLIKHMDFTLDSDDLPIIFEELLRLAFTPSIQQVTGSVKAVGFFTTIFDIIGASKLEFEDLSNLPIYSGKSSNSNDISIKKLFAIKNHCSSLMIPVPRERTASNNWRLLLALDQFKALISLDLQGNADGLKDLEEVSKGCPRLTILKFTNFELCAPTQRELTKVEIDAWNAANVTKQESVRTIEINSTYRPEMIEYLVYKYPNIKSIEIKGTVWSSNRDASLNNGSVARVLDAIQHIKSTNVTVLLPVATKMKDAVRFSKSRDEDIEFDIEELENREQLLLRIG
ncbi:hypothetical protein MBANPS3_010578 [Mucor bainieri]